MSDVVQGAFGPVHPACDRDRAGRREAAVRGLRGNPQAARALECRRRRANTAYDTFEDARAGGATFAEAAKKAAIPVKTVPAVDSQGNGPDGKPVDLPAGNDLLDQAFQTEPGFDNAPVNLGSNGYVFYDVVSINPAHDRTLDEVKDKVVADWKEEQTRDALQKKAEALKAEVEKGKSIADAAKEVGAEPKTAAAVTRQSGLSELGQSGIAAAFSGPNGTVAATPASNPDSRLILKVTEVSPPADPQSNVGQQERQQMNAMLENDLVQSYVTLLQNQYPVSVNPAAIDQAKAMVR